jgi:hypothetical protein
MAKNESTSNIQAPDAEPRSEVRTFKAVRLSRREADDALLPGTAVQRFAEHVQDVASGAASILRLIEWDEIECELEPDNIRPPLLSCSDKNAMLRLVAASMDLLWDQSDHLTTWAYEHHTEEGRAERLRAATQMVNRHTEKSRPGGIA